MGLPILHCKHNFLHVFFENEKLASHESDCPSKPKKVLLTEQENEWMSKSAACEVKVFDGSSWADDQRLEKSDELLKPMPIDSGRSWESTTAGDEKSPEEVTEPKLSYDSDSEQKQGSESYFKTFLKILIVWFAMIASCIVLYAMVQSMDPNSTLIPAVGDKECEATKEPILIALNGMI